jgi:hypothetical protein
MKRIFSVLAVTAFMVAMLVASAMPAFAGANHPTYGQCHKGISEGFIIFISHSELNEEAQPVKSQGNQGDIPIACQF